MKRRIVTVLIAGLLMAVLCGQALGEGLSREQGDIIINELRQIRQVLEKQQKAAAAPGEPAKPERVRLKIGRETALGRSDAPLVMLEYTDYQCAYCNRFYTTTFPELKKQYIDTGKLRFISRDFPLDFHQNAMKAAQATRCAGDQEKFWQMKDALMTNYARLTPALITSLARDAALDMEKFQACVDGGKYLIEIKEGVAAANAIGINGTPSFVLGKVTGDYLEGYLVVGAQPLTAFEGLLKQLQPGPRQ
ncbi:MAG TPA: thioredoxin domain-containing protein [Geobacteraceae bacterium]|nr:thioredoxin domain-containing protein [Geobacteraceae bacterium]